MPIYISRTGSSSLPLGFFYTFKISTPLGAIPSSKKPTHKKFIFKKYKCGGAIHKISHFTLYRKGCLTLQQEFLQGPFIITLSLITSLIDQITSLGDQNSTYTSPFSFDKCGVYLYGVRAECTLSFPNCIFSGWSSVVIMECWLKSNALSKGL